MSTPKRYLLGFFYVIVVFSIIMIMDNSIQNRDSQISDLETKLELSHEANRSLHHQNEMLNDILKNR